MGKRHRFDISPDFNVVLIKRNLNQQNSGRLSGFFKQPATTCVFVPAQRIFDHQKSPVVIRSLTRFRNASVARIFESSSNNPAVRPKNDATTTPDASICNQPARLRSLLSHGLAPDSPLLLLLVLAEPDDRRGAWQRFMMDGLRALPSSISSIPASFCGSLG